MTEEVVPEFRKRVYRGSLDFLFAGSESSPEGLAALGARVNQVLAHCAESRIAIAPIMMSGYVLSGTTQLVRSAQGQSRLPEVQVFPQTGAVDIQGDVAGSEVVIMDNSLHSGASLERSVRLLKQHGLHVATFVKLVQHDGPREAHARSCAARLGLEVRSVYNAKELAGVPWLSLGHHIRSAANSLRLS